VTEPVRTLVVCCLDWPLTALGVAPSDPAMVLASGRVAAPLSLPGLPGWWWGSVGAVLRPAALKRWS